MEEPTLDLLSEIESIDNFLRGMCFDPALPKHIKEAVLERVARIDEVVESFEDEID